VSSSAPRSPATTGWRRVVAALKRVRSPAPQVRAVLLVVAVVAVGVGLAYAVRALDVRPDQLRWGPLVVAALVVSPLTLAANAAELRLAAAVVAPPGRTMPWGTAGRTVVAATVANLLPLPAGALLRVEAVRRVGVGVAPATGTNLVAAGLWVAAGMGIAGVAALTSRPAAGLLGIGLAVVAVAVSVVLAHRIGTPGWRRPTAALVALELGTALLHGARLWLVLVALGVPATLRQALVLGAAAPLAAAAGVFPSGLGLAEGLTALLAPVAALPAAAGFLATALGRVVGLTATGVVAFAFGAGAVREAVSDARARAATGEEEISERDASGG
jgi:hypothetical protein